MGGFRHANPHPVRTPLLHHTFSAPCHTASTLSPLTFHHTSHLPHLCTSPPTSFRISSTSPYTPYSSSHISPYLPPPPTSLPTFPLPLPTPYFTHTSPHIFPHLLPHPPNPLYIFPYTSTHIPHSSLHLPHISTHLSTPLLTSPTQLYTPPLTLSLTCPHTPTHISTTYPVPLHLNTFPHNSRHHLLICSKLPIFPNVHLSQCSLVPKRPFAPNVHLSQSPHVLNAHLSGLPEFRILTDFRHFTLQIGTHRYYSKNAFFLKAPTFPRVPSVGIFCVRYLTFLSYACVFIRVRKLTYLPAML